MKKILLLSLLLLFINYSYSNKKLFNYNKETAVKYAIVALEEFDYYNERKAIHLYDLTKPIVHPFIHKILKDNNGNYIKVLLIIFRSKKSKENNAYVHLVINDFGMVLQIMDCGYTILSIEQIIKDSDFVGLP